MLATIARGLAALALVAPLAVHAADEKKDAKKEPTAQQQRMASCNKEAGDKQLKGDDRKAFMSDCLSGKVPDKKPTQQEKMTACNKQAGDKQLKGDDRKKFMSDCLKS